MLTRRWGLSALDITLQPTFSCIDSCISLCYAASRSLLRYMDMVVAGFKHIASDDCTTNRRVGQPVLPLGRPTVPKNVLCKLS